MKKILSFMLAVVACLAVFAFVGCGETNGHGEVSELIVVSEPAKTEYAEGETFDSTGLVINAKYEDGHIEENVNYNVKAKEPLKRTDKTVTVTYGGRRAVLDITVTYAGNVKKYSVAECQPLSVQPLKGKTYFFLGSSVTRGEASEGESMADFIAKRQSCAVLKEAVSGTTLADTKNPNKGKSYVTRLEEYIAGNDKAQAPDAFVCQLSTNDMYSAQTLGAVTADAVTDKNAFAKNTTYGAMEYIIALVKEAWNCPIVFFTNNNIDNATYKEMVDATKQIAGKWDNVFLLNLYDDEAFNNITAEQKALWLADVVHPTRAGYRDWWTPKFEEILASL